MVSQPLYHAQEIATIMFLSLFCDLAKQTKDIAIFLYSVLNKTSIPLALVGYEIITANEACRAQLAIIIS